MKNNYIAYDDEGTFCTGTKRECLNSIVDLVEDGELDHAYGENDRVHILNYFSREHEASTFIEFSGFVVEEVVEELE